MDRISFVCSHCGASILASPSLAGHTRPCPKCKADVTWAVPVEDAPDRKPEPDSFIEIITFRRMLTPILIQILFWAAAGAAAIFGGSMFLDAIQNRDNPLKVMTGLGCMIVGPILVRIWCELTVVLFAIHRELKIANDRKS